MSKKTYKKKCRYKYTKQESLDLDLANTRPGYFDKNSYFIQLSDASIYPVIDLRDDILKRGHQDYSKVLQHMKDIF